MSRMPLRPPILNPEHHDGHERFVVGTCTSGAIIGDNCKSGDCPEHGLFAKPHLVAGFVALERQTQMRGWKDSRGEAVTKWPTMLLPSATVIIYEPIVQHMRVLWHVLVHRRADNGWWGFVGGRQEIGESIEQCAIREAKEESGLDVALERLVSVDSAPEHGAIVAYAERTIQYTNLTFLARAVGGNMQLSEESTELRWCYTDMLPTPFLPSHTWRLKQALTQPSRIPVR